MSEYLGRPATQVDFDSAAAYIAGVESAPAADPSGVMERGRAAGQALGEDPAAAVRRLVEAVADDLVGADPEQLITHPAAAMRLRDYLPTRTFELVVHGLDISTAVPVRWAPPPDALREAVALAGEVAVLRGEGTMLLRLVTGREPGGFSIV